MLIAGGALRTMRLVNKATSNYHVDAQHACAAREQSRISPEPGFFARIDPARAPPVTPSTRRSDATNPNFRIHLRDRAPPPNTRPRTDEDRRLATDVRRVPHYFLKFAMLQITRAAPAQKDAGGTVDE